MTNYNYTFTANFDDGTSLDEVVIAVRNGLMAMGYAESTVERYVMLE